jgi:outer membrane protein TolC
VIGEQALIKPIYLLLLSSSTVAAAQTQISANDALNLAAKNRPALASAKLRIAEAQASARARAAYSPLEFGIGASSRSDLGATDQDLYLSQDIDLFGRRRTEKNLGSAGVRLAQAEYWSAATALQTEVLSAFAGTVAAKHQRDVAAELQTVADAVFAATKRRFDEGKIAEIQVIRATIERDRARQQADMRTAEYRASTQRLAGLLGTASEPIDVAPDATIEPLASPGIEARPDLRELQAKVAVAEGEAAAVRVGNRPEFSLQLLLSPWGDGRGYLAGRAQLTWRIFDYGRSRNEADAAKLRVQATHREFEDARLRATKELEAVQGELEIRRSRVGEYEKILASAKDLVNKAQKGFTEGFGTQIDVLEATRALREVEEELVEARYQLSLAVIAQYRAAGFLAEVLK